MKKANRNEVPKEYRRNRKKEVTEILIKSAIVLGFVASLILIITKFN